MPPGPANPSAPPIKTVDVLILGAGAAGLMAAIEAGRRHGRVLVLDHADRPGKKILISGGGRCNFTNLHTAPENFLSSNPHFAKSALSRYTPADFVALVERHRIPFHEKTLGQLFCDRSSRDIVGMLERECAEAKVVVRTSTRILTVASEPDSGCGLQQPGSQRARFRVTLEAEPPILARSVIVATGGLSIPKMGASPFGYQIAAGFGHNIVPCRPGLVPLTFSAEDRDRWCDLAGLSAEVVATVNGNGSLRGKRRLGHPAFREKMLLTHRGLSGPAILQISSFWGAGQALSVDLAPGAEVLAPLLERTTRRDPAAVASALRGTLPARLADRWAALHPPEGWTDAHLQALERKIHAWPVHPAGTEGYEKAEVTAGGVDTDQLDARTMESKLVPGLFFAGEVVDVTGWLGGYNFQWAWASGVAAGSAA